MLRKIISLIILAALLLNMMGLTGCTDLVRLPMGEVDLDPPKTITKLKMKSGGYVRWQAGGPNYVRQTRLFDGVARTGQQQYVRLSSVDSVYFVVGSSSVERALEAEAFHKAVIKKERDSVRGRIEGVVCDTGKIVFEKNTAYIDTTSRAVIGLTKQGDILIVPLSQVESLNVRRGNTVATVLAVVSITAVVSLVALGIAVSQSDFGIQ